MDHAAAPGPTSEQRWLLVERLLRGELSAEQLRSEQSLSPAELEDWLRDYRRAARLALDAEMAAALTARGLDPEPLSNSEFSGNIDGMAVAELVQTLQYNRKDAAICIDHDGQQSFLWCSGGDIVDARSGALSGEDAVYRALALRQGHIQADFAPVIRERKIEASTQALLLESAKRYDECRALREQLGDMHAVYVPKLPLADGAELGPDERELLESFSNGRSIDQVVNASRWPDLEALERVARLQERQLLERHVRRVSQPPASARSVRYPSIGLSVRPLVASLGGGSSRAARSSLPLWLSAVAGVVVVSAAFAVGYWSARRVTADAGEPAQVQVTTREPGAGHVRESKLQCPSGMTLIAGSSGARQQDAYCIERAEVSVADFEACVRSGNCSPAVADASPVREVAVRGEAPPACNAGKPGHESAPVNCVNYQQAQRYCEWRGARLPTETEWLTAAESSSDLGLTRGLAEWTSGLVESRAAPQAAGSYDTLHVVLGGIDPDLGDEPPAQPPRAYLPSTASARRLGFRCALDAG